MNDDLFGSSPDANTSIPVPAGGPAPQSSFSTWDFTLSVLCLLVFLFATFVLWRLRSLRKELRLLAGQVVEGFKPPVSRFGLPKFGLRTLLVLITLAAVLLGTFGSELMRARRQARAIDHLNQAGKFGMNVNASYQLGLLGDGQPAESVCHWLHPHFGCRMHRLSLNISENWNRSRDAQAEQRIQGDVDLIELATFRDLEELQLCDVDLGQDTLQIVANLKDLRRLSLIDCRLPEDAVQRLAALPKLRSLQLRSCGISDSALSGLDRMTELRELNLSENPLTDKAADRIATLKDLTKLNIAGTQVTGAGLARLAPLERLQTIDLQRTEVDFQGLRNLDQFPSLRYVMLFGSKVGWELKPSEHKQAKELFIERPAVELYWHVMKNDGTWQVHDNRPMKVLNKFRF